MHTSYVTMLQFSPGTNLHFIYPGGVAISKSFILTTV